MPFPKRLQQILILSSLFCLPFYFIKLKYSWISLNLIEILIVALFLFWIFNKEKKFSIRNSPARLASQLEAGKQYLVPAILILAGVAFSILVNKNYYVGLGIIKGWFVLPIIFAVILYDNLKKDEKLLDKIFIVLFASGAFVAIEGIYFWFSGLLTYDGRLRIFFDSPNQLAMFLAPVLLIGIAKFGESLALRNARSLALGREKPNFEKKAELWKAGLITVGIFLATVNLYLTKSYGAWLAVFLTLITIFWLKYREIWQKKYLFIAIIIFITLLVSMGFVKFENIKKLGERSSLASREMIWKSAGLMIQKNPLFGIGPGNFQEKYLEYQKYFSPYLEWSVPQPHNLFLAFWLEAGLLGLIGFIWLLVLFFRDNKKVYPFIKIDEYNNNSIHEIKKQTGNSLDDKEYFGGGARSLYGELCLAIILYFLIHGLVDTTYWRNDIAILFWVVIAANLFLAKKRSKEN